MDEQNEFVSPPQAPEKSDKQGPFDYALKLFPLVLAATYIVGFVIVALHLAGYGASPLDLIKIQYLAAGFWFGGSVAVYFGVVGFVSTLYEQIGTGRGKDRIAMSSFAARILASVAAVAMILLGNSLVLYVLRRIPGSLFQHIAIISEAQKPWVRLIFPFVFYLAVSDVMWRVYLRLKPAHKRPGSIGFPKATLLIFAAISTVGALEISIRSFASNIYPEIPFSLGGGKPRQVVFWLGENTPSNTFLQREGTGAYSVPYELLVENETALVVISPKENQRVIEFDRKSVQAVVVLGKRPPSAPANFQRNVTEGAK